MVLYPLSAPSLVDKLRAPRFARTRGVLHKQEDSHWDLVSTCGGALPLENTVDSAQEEPPDLCHLPDHRAHISISNDMWRSKVDRVDPMLPFRRSPIHHLLPHRMTYRYSRTKARYILSCLYSTYPYRIVRQISPPQINPTAPIVSSSAGKTMACIVRVSRSAEF